MNNLQWRKSQWIQKRPLVFCACHLRNVAVMNARYCEIIKKHLKALGSSHMWVDGWGGNGNPELALVISGALASSNHMAWSAQLPQTQASSSGVHHGGRGRGPRAEHAGTMAATASFRFGSLSAALNYLLGQIMMLLHLFPFSSHKVSLFPQP